MHSSPLRGTICFQSLKLFVGWLLALFRCYCVDNHVEVVLQLGEPYCSPVIVEKLFASVTVKPSSATFGILSHVWYLLEPQTR
jgi:hypothetical protein